MKIEYQDRIEDYLFNRMADDERQSFEQELENDAELRDQYEFITMVKTALMLENIDNDVNEWTKAYKERQEEEESGYKATGSGYECNTIGPAPRATSAPPRSSNRKLIYWISGIAALFIVGFFLFKNIYFVGDADVAYSPRPQGVSTIRGIDSTTENLLAKADYQAALERIENLEDEIATELMILEREKGARGAEGEDELTYKQDELKFKQAYKQDELKFKQEELSWLKVQALLGLNRKEEAIALLDKIRNSDSEYKEQADSLYNVLKK